MARTRKYYLKNNYLTLRSKVKVSRRSLWYATHALWSCTHIPNIIEYLERQKSYGPDKLRREEAEAEGEIRLKQLFSLRSKRRHNYTTDAVSIKREIKIFLNSNIWIHYDFWFKRHLLISVTMHSDLIKGIIILFLVIKVCQYTTPIVDNNCRLIQNHLDDFVLYFEVHGHTWSYFIIIFIIFSLKSFEGYCLSYFQHFLLHFVVIINMAYIYVLYHTWPSLMPNVFFLVYL